MTVDVEVVEAPRPRTPLLFVVAGAIAAGVLAALMGPVVFLGAAFLTAIAGILLYPREAALPVAFAAPLAELAILRVPGVIDVRFHQILWLALLFSLVARAFLGRPLVLGRPPRWLIWGFFALTAWQLASSLANGGGTRMLVEVVQTAYYGAVVWLIGASYAALPPERRRAIMRSTGVVSGLLVLGWIVYHLSGARLPISVIANLGGGVDFLVPGMTVQAAGESGVVLTRMGMFSLAAVSGASVLTAVPGLTLAVAVASADARDRVLAWVLFGIATVALLLTFSRMGWIIGVLVVLLVGWRLGRGVRMWIWLALAVAVMMLLAVPAISARLQDFSNPNEDSLLSHVSLYERALDFANAQPIFGGGPHTFVERTRNRWTGEETPVHNFVLEAASETGWPGAALAVALVTALLVWGWRRLKAAPAVDFAFWTGLLATVLMALTMNGFREDTLWVWAGFMVGAGISAVPTASSEAGTSS